MAWEVTGLVMIVWFGVIGEVGLIEWALKKRAPRRLWGHMAEKGKPVAMPARHGCR